MPSKFHEYVNSVTRCTPLRTDRLQFIPYSHHVLNYADPQQAASTGFSMLPSRPLRLYGICNVSR